MQSFPTILLAALAIMMCLSVHALDPLLDSIHATRKTQLRRNLRRNGRLLLQPRSATRVLSPQQRRILTTNTWSQMGAQTNGKFSGEQFGYSVALSATGTVLVSSAPLNDQGGQNRGRLRVYQYLLNNWTESGDFGGQANFDEFGLSVATNTNGNRLIAGSPGSTDGNDVGKARVFQYNTSAPSKWSQMGQDLIGTAAGDHAGTSVAMNSDGTVVAVGSPYHDTTLPDNTVTVDAGEVRVYQWNASNSNWTELAPSIQGVSANSFSGYSVDLAADGKVVAIGAPDHKGVGDMSGQVRVYMRKDKKWNLLGKAINGTQVGEMLGYDVSLSLDGMTVAVGRPNLNVNGTKSGAVQVYKYTSASESWTKVGKDMIKGARINDNLGASISLSADGRKLATKSNYEVRQFAFFENNTWTQVGPSIGNFAAPDTIAMSADGNKIAIGDIGGASNFGQVAVWSIPDNMFGIKLVNIMGSFLDSSNNLPEVELTYVNSVTPNGGYYKVTILDANCAVVDSSGSILPRLNGNITAGTTSDVVVQIDVDTSSVVQANYYTPGTTADKGTIDFCCKIDYYDMFNQNVATESNKIKLELDQRVTFQTGSGGNAQSGPPIETVHYVDFEYTTQTYFCNDNNDEVIPGPRSPGQVVQFCVRTPQSSDVEVKGLRTVVFKNTKVPLLAIPVIDEYGVPSNNMTSITCNTAICNVRSVAFSDLYEYVLSNGTLVDVSEYVALEGRALLAFADGRRRLSQEFPFVELSDVTILETDSSTNPRDEAALKAAIAAEDEEAATGFRLHVDLARPPTHHSAASSWLNSFLVAGLSTLGLLLL